MTDLAATRPSILRPNLGWAALAAVAVLAIAADHPPRWELIAAAATPIRIHLAAAVATFLLGMVLMLGAKGNLAHRTLGWTWAATMAVTAVSSLFIHEIRPGGFSFIHAF